MNVTGLCEIGDPDYVQVTYSGQPTHKTRHVNFLFTTPASTPSTTLLAIHMHNMNHTCHCLERVKQASKQAAQRNNKTSSRNEFCVAAKPLRNRRPSNTTGAYKGRPLLGLRGRIPQETGAEGR